MRFPGRQIRMVVRPLICFCPAGPNTSAQSFSAHFRLDAGHVYCSWVLRRILLFRTGGASGPGASSHIDVFPHGIVVSGAPTRSSAMLPVTMFFFPQHLGLIDVFLLGVVVSGAPTRSSAMLPVTMFFSPQHLGLGKEKERDSPSPICNQPICLSGANGSPCLAASDVILLPFVIFLRLCYLIDAIFFPFPLPPVTRLFTLSLTVKDGEECQTFVFILICVCSFSCFSRCFLLFCCFPAARPLLSWLSLSRGARPRRPFNFNRRPRGKIPFLLMCAHASAHCYLVFI